MLKDAAGIRSRQSLTFTTSPQRSPRTRLLLSALLLVLAASGEMCIVAAADKRPWEQPGLSGDPKAILEAAQEIANPKGADISVFLDEVRYSIDSQQRITETTRLVYRINAAGGVEDWSSIGANWEPWHQEQPQVSARVITADGGVHMLDPKNMTDAPVEGDSPDTFSDDRRYHGPLPGAAIGAIVEEEIVIRDTAPYFEGGLSSREYFGRTVPVQHSRLVLESPASAPLHYAVHLMPAATIKKEEFARTVRVTVEMGPMEAMREEATNLPTDIPNWPHADFATGNTWKEVSDAYLLAVESHIHLGDLKNALPALSKDATRDQIIRATVAKLHKDVRYTGVEFGRSKLVPASTAEILKRKFGDCKDKSTLLVAMLRAEGIKAHLALLDSGDQQDVESDMPGLGMFDHAIVVVPGVLDSSGAPGASTADIWIDATAEYTPVGVLPGEDQGRAALVIRDGTQGLQLTPEVKSTDNVSVEKREFFLSEMGPARLVETSEPAGDLADDLRSHYSGKLSGEIRKELETYFQSNYLAEKITNIEAGDGADLNKPYALRVEAAKAKRGTTDEQTAIVAIPVSNIFGRLPTLLRSEQEEDKNDKNADAGRELSASRTQDVVLPEAFAQEWHYRIVPPPGFQVHGLPKNKVVPIGPAKLTEEFNSANDNTVTALFRFDTVKRRFTADEARQIRTTILKMDSSPMLLISFDQVGYALLRAGKIRESLANYRSLVAQHPRAGLYRAQMANALLQAGLGEKARAEAIQATRLEPTSAFTFKTLGWVLQHDLIGRRFERGFDREGAIAAYRRAKELDPKDVAIRADLAILLEHDSDGERYTHAANMKEAVKEYRDLKAKDKDNTSYDDNLAYALLYAGDFEQASSFISEIGPTPVNRRAIFIAAVAAESSAEEAIKRSAEITSNEDDRVSALYSAGLLLMNMRLYPRATELMQASPQTNDALRRTQRAEDLTPPSDPAAAVVQKWMVELFTGAQPEKLLSLLSRNTLNDGRTDAEHRKDVEKQMATLRTTMKGNQVPYRVLVDISLSNMQFSTESGDGGVYRVTMQALGTKNEPFIVVKEAGAYKMLRGGGADIAEVGREVQDRLSRGDLATAKTLLDWTREVVAAGGGDDPLAGKIFPRFWTRGQAADKDAMEYAATTLLVDNPASARDTVAVLKRGQANTAIPADQIKFELALAVEYDKEENWIELKSIAERLVGSAPQSERAFVLLTHALGGQKDWSTWDRVAQERLTRIPNDPAALRSAARCAAMQNQFERARSVLKPMIDNGRATSFDMNQFAWYALFAADIRPEDLLVAQRALAMEKNNNFGIMHTLACLLARSGKAKEARDLLLQSMKVGGFEVPNSEIWLGLGLLAEQYGEYGAAREAYARIEKPKRESPASSYALMQLRMKAIDLDLKKPSAATGQ